MTNLFKASLLATVLLVSAPAHADIATVFGKTACPDGYSTVYQGRLYSYVGGGRKGGNTGNGGIPNTVNVTAQCLPPSSAPSGMPQAVFDVTCVVCKRD